MKKVLSTKVRGKATMKMTVERLDNWINIWPEYTLHFDDDLCFLMAGKKVSRTPYSIYVMSTKNGTFQENIPEYLGKAKSSLLGDQLDIYGPGFNPNNAF